MTQPVESVKGKARELVSGWKGQAYVFGLGCLERAPSAAAEVARRALVVANPSAWLAPTVDAVTAALQQAGVEIAGRADGARPNSPREDVYRIQDAVAAAGADVVIAVGGGSTIDAAKAAAVLATLQGGAHDIEPYFGAGKVSDALAACGAKLPAMVAVQTAASSAAHLTKYSNITDPASSQKKLIIDEAIVPPRAVFDYQLTRTAPAELTLDGAFDGIGHLVETYYGAAGGTIDRLEEIAAAGVELIVTAAAAAVADPDDLPAREALGLATDLGGCAIMVGGTNGPHLNSFSFVDVLAHGRACAILVPYYTVFFAPAVQRQLRLLAEIYSGHGLLGADLAKLAGRDLGLAVAEGMMTLSRQVGFPTTLGEVAGFSAEHIDRALAAAKNPQLASKLQAMPTPMSAEQVDEYMGSVLQAALSGDLSGIRNLPTD